jgi:hypothetical protein
MNLVLKYNWHETEGGGGAGLFLYHGTHTHVPLEWVIFMTSQIYQCDAIFINLLYQWVDNLARHYMYVNGW